MKASKTLKVGFVGVGAISGIYLKNLTSVFKSLEIIGVCDLIRERAEKAVAEHGIPKLYNDMQELFADPEVDIVLNITRPYEHYDVTKAALLAGKHVYSEKPLAATLEGGMELAQLAKEKGLYLGGAPDTYLGAGLQTCRKLIDDGFIGRVTGASAAMLCRGHETWHPDPEFYYKAGGGPLFDMGPYYITALMNLLGGVKSVVGMTHTPFPERTITSQPHCGEIIHVDVPTTVCGVLKFENGALGTLNTSFDTTHNNGNRLEVYGSEGTLYCPDPNTFGGDVFLQRRGSKEAVRMPLLFDYNENSRGLGMADMADAILNGREPKAGVQQTLHALAIMSSIIRSGETGCPVDICCPYTRQPAMTFGQG